MQKYRIFGMSIYCRLFVVIMIGIVGFHCAGQMAPPGGPLDTIPPTVEETFPENKTIGFHDTYIRISFSEWVDKQSVFESIFISPDLGELELDWSGKEVDILFEDSLRENTTYVLTLGTDVKDLRGGNNLAEAFSLAFSTGDHIDSCALSGKIFDKKQDGVMVFAYILDGRNGDTLNPSRTKPDYLTQTGKDGTFQLPYLRIGNYRLVAMRDEYKNLLYDAQTDEYGIPQQEFLLTTEKDLIEGISIRMTVQDTTAPFLSSARGVDEQHVLLKFSEPIDTSTLRPGNIILADTLTGSILSVIDASPSDSSLSEAILLTGQQESTKTYSAQVNRVSDINGNFASLSSKPFIFDGSGMQDTLKPHPSLRSFTNDSKDIFPRDSIILAVSEWVNRAKFEHGLAIQDTGKNIIPFYLTWFNATHFALVPERPFLPRMQYAITVILDSAIDVAGNRYIDSLVTYKFGIIDIEKLGNITGSVEKTEEALPGNIYLLLNPLEEQLRSQTIVLEKPGNFSFEKLQEGKYILSAFIDTDSNKTYTYGALAPFQLSEKFFYYPDTLRVRARWTVENVMMKLK